MAADGLAVEHQRRDRFAERPGEFAVGGGLALVDLRAFGMKREHRGAVRRGDRRRRLRPRRRPQAQAPPRQGEQHAGTGARHAGASPGCYAMAFRGSRPTLSRKPVVVSHFWSGPTSSARSLVMKPDSTVSIVTFSSVAANFASSALSSSLARWASPRRPGKDRGDRIGRGLAALLMLAIVPRHRAVRGLGLDDLAVRRGQHRGHQSERAVALRHRVGLHVAVVVLARPDIAARPFERRRHHVVDQPVLVGEFLLREFVLEFVVEDFLENVLEAAVIDFDDGVLGREIERIAAVERVVHRGAGEVADRCVEIVHRHGDARARETGTPRA